MNPFYNQTPFDPKDMVMKRLDQMGLHFDNPSDPNAILQQLLSSGRVSQQQVNHAYQMAQRFK